MGPCRHLRDPCLKPHLSEVWELGLAEPPIQQAKKGSEVAGSVVGTIQWVRSDSASQRRSSQGQFPLFPRSSRLHSAMVSDLGDAISQTRLRAVMLRARRLQNLLLGAGIDGLLLVLVRCRQSKRTNIHSRHIRGPALCTGPRWRVRDPLYGDGQMAFRK